MQIAFIGGGVMAEAMIGGILAKGLTTPDAIIVGEIDEARRNTLFEWHGVHTTGDNREAIAKADVVILSIKPQSLPEVMAQLKGRVRDEQLVLSIVAGASIATIRSGLDHKSIIRVIPNTPAQIGEGMSVWTTTNEVSEAQKDMARSFLQVLGKEKFVADEKSIDMATAVSGSGPAYIFLVIESLIDAAVQIGMRRDMAQELVVQTVIGSGRLAESAGKHLAELRNMVTSPGGTTAEGLYRLEENRVRAAFAQAVIAGYEKAKGLGGISSK